MKHYHMPPLDFAWYSGLLLHLGPVARYHMQHCIFRYRWTQRTETE